MVQRSKSEASWSLLGGFPGILGAIAFGFVFSFGLGPILPLHVAGTVGPAAFQGLNVVNNEPFAFSCKFPGRRAGRQLTELMLCVVGAKDSAARVPSASFTPSSSEGRKDKK